MPTHIDSPTMIEAAGSVPKVIREYVGRVNTKTDSPSIAVMESPEGWSEPGQRPEFDEYTVVLEGLLEVHCETTDVLITVAAGQAIHTRAGEWVRYATPLPGGAKYVAVCLPAFGPDIVHRDV